MAFSSMETGPTERLQPAENLFAQNWQSQIYQDSSFNRSNQGVSDQSQPALSDNGNTLVIPSIWNSDNPYSPSGFDNHTFNPTGTGELGTLQDITSVGQGLPDVSQNSPYDSLLPSVSLIQEMQGFPQNSAYDSGSSNDASIWQEAKNAISSGVQDIAGYLGFGSSNSGVSDGASSGMPTLMDTTPLFNAGGPIADGATTDSGFRPTIMEGAPLFSAGGSSADGVGIDSGFHPSLVEPAPLSNMGGLRPIAGGTGDYPDRPPLIVHQGGEDPLAKAINDLDGKSLRSQGYQGDLRLGCAQAVSEALHQVNPEFGITNNLNQLHKELTQQGWTHQEVTPDQLDHLPPGAVIFGQRQPGMSGHAAISEGNGKIFDNDSDRGIMTKEDSVDKFKVPMYNDGKFNANGYEHVIVYLPPDTKAA